MTSRSNPSRDDGETQYIARAIRLPQEEWPSSALEAGNGSVFGDGLRRRPLSAASPAARSCRSKAKVENSRDLNRQIRACAGQITTNIFVGWTEKAMGQSHMKQATSRASSEGDAKTIIGALRSDRNRRIDDRCAEQCLEQAAWLKCTSDDTHLSERYQVTKPAGSSAASSPAQPSTARRCGCWIWCISHGRKSRKTGQRHCPRIPCK